MRLVRSWPSKVPAGRAHVVDGIERLVMNGYDYRCLSALDDDVILVEWDIAVGLPELETFARRCQDNRGQARCAPYRIHESFTGRTYHFHPLWSCRRYLPGEQSIRHVTPDDKTCHLFGFGMTYLPRHYVRAFLSTWGGHVDDVAFSGWHYRNADDPEVPVDWDCAPVHLHYHLPEVSP